MKRLSTIIMALVLVLGLTQCKKDQPNPNVTEGETYTINLSVKGNSNAKVDVNTTTGTVDYTTGDQIHVASGGKYVGTLTYNGTVFTGNITNAVEGEPLQFYFLGNVTPAEELTSGVTESCSVVISDQTEHLPVISGAASVEIFEGNNSDYTAELLNKCALVKFNVTTASEAATCLKGFNNKVTIDFGQNSFTNSQEGEGIITLPAGNGEQWAILLPQEAMNGGEAYSANESHNGTFGAVPAIYANAMFTVGVPVEVNTVWHIDPLATPLTFEAREDGAQVGINNTSGINLQYSTDGVNWNDYSSAITLTHAGDIVSFRGNNTSFNYNKFTCSGNCYIYGNVMSLLHAGDYATNYALSEDALIYLFSENINIDIHPYKDLVLPATQLEEYCYAFMFYDCTGLTKAPALPAETMANYCYAFMFSGCTGLQTAPELPATTLATNCYQSMFSYCTGLTVAPELNAPNLAQGCYANMFSSCTSLNTVPNLPATVLADGCYGGMFSGCMGLTTVPTLPVTTLAGGCYASMFEDCSNLTTAPALPATTLAEECYAFMFSGCTKLTTAPELPATTLVDGCYYYMFYGCTSLNSITCLATSGFGSLECTEEWVTDVASTGTFYADPAATWSTGTDGIPTDWTRKNPDGSDWVAPAPAHEYVDLGLPSGTLWATCNIGADNPEDYGDYFAWGETTTKTTYYWNNYQYCNGSYNKLTKYCNSSSYGYSSFTDNLTTLLPEDDAATANWGSDWRMPTKAEFEELYNNTTVTWTQLGGVNGRLFTAKNRSGNSLFLPAAGRRVNAGINDVGSNGYYWSSSLHTTNSSKAWYSVFTSGYQSMDYYFGERSNGFSVRAVRPAPQN